MRLEWSLKYILEDFLTFQGLVSYGLTVGLCHIKSSKNKNLITRCCGENGPKLWALKRGGDRRREANM
jgi:hypothetical protein